MTMILRSLVACSFLATGLIADDATAQVLLCPEPSKASGAAVDAEAEAERLLKRLTIALDLHGHRGISEGEILDVHAETPSALLAKLTNVTDRCIEASADLDGFHDTLPQLRRAFLDATDVSSPAELVDGDVAVQKAGREASEAERIEQSIDLSVRELWRKLWFRPAEDPDEKPVEDSDDEDARWAVIVSSPESADKGWDDLAEHQQTWKDAYFQLHEPYYESNPHHAIVVGRRLPREQASRLRDYVIELGMAEDSYLWPLPEEGAAVVAEPISDETANASPDDAGPEVDEPEMVDDEDLEAEGSETASDKKPQADLDLTILEQ